MMQTRSIAQDFCIVKAASPTVEAAHGAIVTHQDVEDTTFSSFTFSRLAGSSERKDVTERGSKHPNPKQVPGQANKTSALHIDSWCKVQVLSSNMLFTIWPRSYLAICVRTHHLSIANFTGLFNPLLAFFHITHIAVADISSSPLLTTRRRNELSHNLVLMCS